MASSEATVGKGAFLLGVYSLGLGIPFIVAALAMEPFIGFLRRFKAHFGKVERVVGVLLVLTGIAFLTGGIQNMLFWLIQTFPGLATLGRARAAFHCVRSRRSGVFRGFMARLRPRRTRAKGGPAS